MYPNSPSYPSLYQSRQSALNGIINEIQVRIRHIDKMELEK